MSTPLAVAAILAHLAAVGVAATVYLLYPERIHAAVRTYVGRHREGGAR